MKPQDDPMDGESPTIHSLNLPDMGITGHVIIEAERGYFPLPAMCRALGLSDAQTQRQKLADHRVLSTMLRQFNVPTRQGVRLTWCLERRAIGFWLGTINVGKVKPELQDRLLQFQWMIIEAIDALMRKGRPVEIDTPANLARFTLSLEERIGRLEELRGDEE